MGHRSEIATVLADLGVLTRAAAIEIVESGMANSRNKIKAEVVKIGADTFEDAIKSIYSECDEGLKLAMFSIVEQAFIEVVGARCSGVFDEMQLARLMRSDQIVEQIVKCVLSSTSFLVPGIDIVRKLVDKSFDNQRLKNMDKTLTLKIITELWRECSSDRH